MNLLDRLKQVDVEMQADRRRELQGLCDRLHSAIMNIPCDLSATAPEHRVAVKAGHKQARHRAAEIVCEMFVAAVDE